MTSKDNIVYTAVRAKLKLVLVRLAGLIVRFPKLKQLILLAISALPPSTEERLRRVIAPSNRFDGIPTNVPCLLSAKERLLIRDLNQRLRKHSTFRGNNREKPRLAYFSPLPPEKSGISHYSLMLLPELAKRFDIVVIVDQEKVNAPPLEPLCSIKPYRWFIEHADEFDRILYHIGNSHFHTHMFDALRQWPGVVVLHDYFLGHVIRHMDYLNPGYLSQRLYEGWGFTLLAANKDNLHREEIIWDHPLNADVLKNALGIIAHSAFSKTLTETHYGKNCQAQWHFIPHLREPAPDVDRDAVRDQLAIPRDDFVVCSFGHITPTKLHGKILRAWQASILNSDKQCRLIFVGEVAEGHHGRLIRQLIKKAENPRIQVTGWADTDTFESYLSAADVAVQLRSRSRGETSGAVIDCLNHGLATVVNAHGTMVDLPADSVFRLPDAFDDQALIEGLEKIYADQQFRQRLGEAARATIRENHDPAVCGEQYSQSIERIYQHWSPYWKGLDHALGALGDRQPGEEDIRKLLPALTPSVPTPLQQPQLLVDVSAMVHTDLKTGIERVVRAQLLKLIDNPPANYRVEPVYLHRSAGSWHFHYARAYGWQLLELPNLPPEDEKVDFDSSDVLYMPDLNAHSVTCAAEDGLFKGIKEEGVSIHVLIHDILPVSHPEYFPANAKAGHEAWLRSISEFADQIICISNAVADQYRLWLAQHREILPTTPIISVNHHGADITASKPSRGLPHSAKAVLRQLTKAPSFLMVGTIEPRKGHQEALDAFDKLWQAGVDANLVIIGKEGWKNLPAPERKSIPELVKRLDWHPQRNKKLFWLQDISDEYLEAIYSNSDCLVAASFDEGFGLPLIEAARHELAIIARDIPVFHEVAGNHATYFDDNNKLSDVLQQWIIRRQGGERVNSRGMPTRSWTENVTALKAMVIDSA